MMRKIILLFILLGGVLFFILSGDKEEPIALTPEEISEIMKTEEIEMEPIFHDITSLVELEFFKQDAVRKKKFLMLFFYSDRCYFCEKMKNITFIDSRVQKELTENYISLSINYSRYRAEFKDFFHLRTTPATLFCDQKAKVIDEEIDYGFQEAEYFYNRLELLRDPF